MSRYGDRGSREEFTIEDIARGRTIMASDLDKSFEQVFMCNKAHGDALVRAFRNKKYPRRILVHGNMIVSVKIDDRGFVVHKWTKKIIDLKQVYLVVKDSRKIYQLALEFAQRPGEKKAFCDVLQFDPGTSRQFTQLISSRRKELLRDGPGGGGGPSSGRFSDKYAHERSASGGGRGDDVPTMTLAELDAQGSGPPSAMAAAIAKAQQRGGAQQQQQQHIPEHSAFTPASPTRGDDPFNGGLNSSIPPQPHSPVGNQDSTAGDPFGQMMQSVNQNGHQMQTLFSPSPGGAQPASFGNGGAVVDPFAAPNPYGSQPQSMRQNPLLAQQQQQQPLVDPFAQPQQQQQQQKSFNPFA
jgi:hypothetical protein